MSTGTKRPMIVQYRARETDLPASELLAGLSLRMDWADAFEVSRPPGSTEDPQEWADALFRSSPRWVGALMAVRQVLVGLVGIERGSGEVFDTSARTANEVLLGADQNHLGFRATVLVEPERVVLSTIVDIHNRRGIAYWTLVQRVHPFVIRGMLNRAVKVVEQRTK